MNCPKCGTSLRIGKTFITFEGDHSPDTETKAFTNMPMICINKGHSEDTKCPNYGGEDLSNPIKIVETIKHPLN